MNQVITISPEGEISGLQVKRGRGLLLTELGKAEVRRVSHIMWNEVAQAWQVEVSDVNVVFEILRLLQEVTTCQEDAASELHVIITLALWTEVTGEKFPPKGGLSLHAPGFGPNMWFEDYDDAVQAEIRFLDALRVKGIF